MKKQAGVFAALILVVAITVLGQENRNSPPQPPIVSFIVGKVSSQHANSKTWTLVFQDMLLQSGDRVATESESRVELRLSDSQTLRLAPNSRMQLQELAPQRIRVRLETGLANYEMQSEADIPTEIQTPNVAVRTQSAGVYRVEVKPRYLTEITVREGQAEIMAADGAIAAASGQTIMVKGLKDPLYKTVPAPVTDEWDHWNKERSQLAQGRPAENSDRRQAVSDSATPPTVLTVPTGAIIAVRILDQLSSDQNHPGDAFSAELEQTLVANGWVVAQRNQTVMGRVQVAEKANRAQGRSAQLGVQLTELTLVDGRQMAVTTELIKTVTHTSRRRDVSTVATTTGMGTLIGAAAGGGPGAGAGAGVGAMAGVAGVLVTSSKPAVLPSETVLRVRLEAPLTISTDAGRVAFRPVTPQDYERQADQTHAAPTLSPRCPHPPYWYGPCCGLDFAIYRASWPRYWWRR
jgi:FecR protein